MKVTPRLLGTSLTLLTLSVSCSGSPWQPQNVASCLGRWLRIKGPMEPHPAFEAEVRTAARARRQAMRQKLRRLEMEGGAGDPEVAMIAQSLEELPDPIRNRLSYEFWEELDQWTRDRQNIRVLDYLLSQLEQDPFFMPVIPDFSVRFTYKSPYDESIVKYTLRAPHWDRDTRALVLLLGEEEEYQKVLPSASGYWLLNIPSRPHMNYQLLSEGDLWRIMRDVQEIYPQIKEFPAYIVALGKATDAGLAIANNYRNRFKGLAFSGYAGLLDHPNLDKFPVIHFSSPSQYEGGIWSGNSFVDRLQARGNTLATVSRDGFEETVGTLLSSSRSIDPYATFTFEDYQYAQAWPWLRVLSKWTEDEPCTITCEPKGEELIVNAANVRHIELKRDRTLGFPSDIKRVRFNKRLFALQGGRGPVVLGEGSHSLQATRKVDSPPGMVNFFRNEPLYLVYQDQGASTNYLSTAKEMAERLAAMRFTGLPTLDVTLPRIPLSQYDPTTLPIHRAIIIGQPEFITPVLSRNPYYFPVDPITGIQDTTYDHGEDDDQPTAIGLIYPPERNGKLRLAMLLTSETEEGLELLSEKYSSATSLYDPHDLRVWKQSMADYWTENDESFDGFWCCSSIPSFDVRIPSQSHQVWERWLRDMVLAESETSSFAIGKLVDEKLQAPSHLTVKTLVDYIPNRHFALVTLTGSASTSIGNKLLEAMSNPVVEGLTDVMDFTAPTPRLDEIKMRKQRKQFLVDEEALKTLTPEERSRIEYRLLPYSLHELVFAQVDKKGQEVGRQLLRVSNQITMAE